LSINHQARDDLAAAIREAFEAARRKLEDHVHRQRGEYDLRAAGPDSSRPPERLDCIDACD